MSRRVAIAGVGLAGANGRADGRTPYALAAESSRRALAEAGLTPRDVDGFGSTGLGTLQPVDVAEYLGLRPRWVDSTAVGGAAWEVMAAHAADAIAQGRVDVVLLSYGSTARSDLRAGLRTANLDWGSRGPQQWEAPYGITLISKYAMAARRHMQEYGTTLAQLAEIAVSARYNAGFNPDAQAREPISVEEVLGSRMIADPFTALQCCLRSDGAPPRSSSPRTGWPISPWSRSGSSVPASTSRTCRWVSGRTSPPGRRRSRGSWHSSGPGWFRATSTCARSTTPSPTCSSSRLEDLGFCGKGEGGPFVEDGRLRLGGAFPTNTDGGGLSSCHPGQRGLFLLVEAVRQLRGEAGERQVPDARLACVSGTGGWFCSSGTMILGTD